MSPDGQHPIIVKRIRKGGPGHHGGAWKIAYADFVTAMMAFFLLMWLLGSTTKGELQGIADYFATPLKVALAGGRGSGDATTLVPGGGKDLSRAEGQVKQGETEAQKRAINLKAAEAERARQEKARLEELKARIERAIEQSELLRNYRNQLRIDMTPDGLRIQIVDEQNRPMFDSGSAEVKGYFRGVLRELSQLLNDVPNRISLSGHTDAKPYSSGLRGYSNWELSADRANASRRELIAGGIGEDKIIRVIGQGPAVMLDKSDPFNPTNRRISIIVLNSEAERRILESLPAEAAPAQEPAPAAAEPARADPPQAAPPR